MVNGRWSTVNGQLHSPFDQNPGVADRTVATGLCFGIFSSLSTSVKFFKSSLQQWKLFFQSAAVETIFSVCSSGNEPLATCWGSRTYCDERVRLLRRVGTCALSANESRARIGGTVVQRSSHNRCSAPLGPAYIPRTTLREMTCRAFGLGVFLVP